MSSLTTLDVVTLNPKYSKMLLLCVTLALVGLILVVILAYNCSLYTANTLLKTDTSISRPALYTQEQLRDIFPYSITLEAKYETIRDQCKVLQDLDYNYLSDLLKYNSIDLKASNLKDWSAIPLRLFGHNTLFLDKVPILGELIKDHPEIVSCIVSRMSPGKYILPHKGPYDGLLRYQLALDIPEDCTSEKCYLTVDDQQYSWKNGQGVLFDETYIHSANNASSQDRIVLLIDLYRPYSIEFLNWINRRAVNMLAYAT